MIKVFDIEDGKVKINENCLLIPELKALVESYTNPIPALGYVHFMTAPDSPYANIPEEDRQQMISEDIGGDFGFEDDVVIAALEKMHKLFETPTMRYYNAIRKSLDMTSAQLSTINALTFGTKDGNAEMIYKMQSNAGKLIEQFKKLEKIKDEELKTALRGKAQSGMY